MRYIDLERRQAHAERIRASLAQHSPPPSATPLPPLAPPTWLVCYVVGLVCVTLLAAVVAWA